MLAAAHVMSSLETTVRGRFVYTSDRRPRSAMGRRRQGKARGHPICRCRHLCKIRRWEQRRPHHHRAYRPRTYPNDLRFPSPSKRCAPVLPCFSFIFPSHLVVQDLSTRPSRASLALASSCMSHLSLKSLTPCATKVTALLSFFDIADATAAN